MVFSWFFEKGVGVDVNLDLFRRDKYERNL